MLPRFGPLVCFQAAGPPLGWVEVMTLLSSPLLATQSDLDGHEMLSSARPNPKGGCLSTANGADHVSGEPASAEGAQIAITVSALQMAAKPRTANRPPRCRNRPP
jgi:hypothetical protein